MIRAQAGQVIGAQMIDATSGAAFIGAVSVFITIDGGTQTAGAGGAAVAEGNGYYSYTPTLAETDGALIAFTFTGAGAIPATIQVATITVTQQAALSAGASASSMTGLQWVRAALTTLEVLDPTATPSPQEASDALQIGNDWIDALALKGFLVYYLLRTVVPLTGAASYTIGVGGTINIPRPVEIDHAGIIIDTSASPLSEIPIDVFTDQQWESIVQKAYSAATYPQGIHYDYNWTAGLATIAPWPIPTQTTISLVLYTPQALTEMTLTGAMTFPPGYRRLLKLGLARELSVGGFGGWDGEKERLYLNAYSDVESRNLRMSELSVGGGRRSNIYTGQV